MNTAGGPAVVNLGEIRGNLQQVIGTLNEAGQGELAAQLGRLAEAIEAAVELGDERVSYLEQVQFIARQAIEPPASRQTSIVKAVFENLRARLADGANLAKIISVIGPPLAQHFGFH